MSLFDIMLLIPIECFTIFNTFWLKMRPNLKKPSINLSFAIIWNMDVFFLNVGCL